MIGAGNVASQLAPAMIESGHVVSHVFSRSIEKAVELANQCNAVACNDLLNIPLNADLYILSIADDAIQEISNKLQHVFGLLVHTSGSQPMSILGLNTRKGVFYPLQTFSLNRKADFSKIPFCIEAENEKDMGLLQQLAGAISTDVRIINSEQRRKIHLAAVFACNFTNYLHCVAEDILSAENISFDIFHPLISECTNKAQELGPINAQTGPARRGDLSVISKHLEMLKSNEIQHKLYELFSREISERFKTK